MGHAREPIHECRCRGRSDSGHTSAKVRDYWSILRGDSRFSGQVIVIAYNDQLANELQGRSSGRGHAIHPVRRLVRRFIGTIEALLTSGGGKGYRCFGTTAMKNTMRLHARCVNLLYGAASGACDWKSVVEAIRSYVGTDLTKITYLHEHRLISERHRSGNVEAEQASCLKQWARPDPMPTWQLDAFPGGVNRPERAFPDRSALRERGPQHKLYRPVGARHQTSAQVRIGNGWYTMLSVRNGSESRQSNDRALQRLENLLPDLNNAMTLATRLRSLECKLRTIERLVAGCYGALIICDSRGIVIESTEDAENMLRRLGGALRVRHGRLEAADPAVNQRLLRLLREPGDPAESGAPVLVLETSAGRFFECLVLDSEVDAMPRLERVVVIRETGEPPLVDVRYLRYRFGLTQCEAQVLARLMMGEGLEKIAADRGSKLETIRSYVKGLLSKLQCHSRAQLVARAWHAAMMIGTAASLNGGIGTE